MNHRDRSEISSGVKSIATWSIVMYTTLLRGAWVTYTNKYERYLGVSRYVWFTVGFGYLVGFHSSKLFTTGLLPSIFTLCKILIKSLSVFYSLRGRWVGPLPLESVIEPQKCESPRTRWRSYRRTLSFYSGEFGCTRVPGYEYYLYKSIVVQLCLCIHSAHVR